jgi:hypothetical protein
MHGCGAQTPHGDVPPTQWLMVEYLSTLHKHRNRLDSTWWDDIILVAIAVAMAGMAATVGAVAVAISM